MRSKTKGVGKFFKETIERKKSEQDIVEILRAHEDFFFMGSRYYKELAEEDEWIEGELDFSNVGDWDFSINYTKFDTELKKFLVGLGFEKVTNFDYHQDCTLYSLYKHKEFKIDVCFRFEFETFKRIWERTTPEFFHKYLWKSTPHRPQDAASVEAHKDFINDWIENALELVGTPPVKVSDLEF